MGYRYKVMEKFKNWPALRDQVCSLWQRSDETIENDTVKGGRIGVFPGGGATQKVWVAMCLSLETGVSGTNC